MSKKDISEIIFRNEEELKEKGIRLNRVADNIDYLTDKLKAAHKVIRDHSRLLTEGEELIEQVHDHFCTDKKYSHRLKADVADYTSKALTYLLEVEEIDQKKHAFQHYFEKQLKPQNRAEFSCGAQIVDALLDLAVRIGAIKRCVTQPWRVLKQRYSKNPSDDIIKGAYQSLVHMKNDIRERYEHFHNLALRAGK